MKTLVSLLNYFTVLPNSSGQAVLSLFSHWPIFHTTPPTVKLNSHIISDCFLCWKPGYLLRQWKLNKWAESSLGEYLLLSSDTQWLDSLFAHLCFLAFNILKHRLCNTSKMCVAVITENKQSEMTVLWRDKEVLHSTDFQSNLKPNASALLKWENLL